jgi:hypothetical protein
MRTNLAPFLFLVVLAAACGLTVVDTLAQDDRVAPIPLAIVGEDTLTTTQLKIELAIMKNRNEQNAPTAPLDPDQVLRRLIQNQLVIQEGFRMGLDREFTVVNQVREVVRHECMAALLDSVARSVSEKSPDIHEARRLAVKHYLDQLEEKYQASYDTALLASLDYGSSDPKVQKYLNESEEILAVMPTGKLTVAAYSRIVRFTEFHGLVGKPNAAEKRDEVFRDWFAEALLNFQFQAQGMEKDPEIVLIAERMERNLVLEETLRVLLEFDFSPSEKEVESYYQSHLDAVTSAPRVKMESLKTANEEPALALREKMLKGTPINWLYSNDPSVIQGPPPFPREFIEPEKLGLKPEVVEVGYIPPPYQVPTGWVVAKIEEVEKAAPQPLDRCTSTILGMMKSEQTQQLMIDILAQLEAVTPVEVLAGAEATVADVILDFEEKGGAVKAEPTANPSREG